MIETPCLLLRRPINDDMLIAENLWRDEKVRQFLGGIISDDLIKQKVVELQNHWDLYQFGLCVVFDKSAKKITGLCGLHHSKDRIELSYMFFSEFWGKGFAREAATACIDYGFNTLKFNKIIAITQEANIKSCQLLLRFSFSKKCMSKKHQSYKTKVNRGFGDMRTFVRSVRMYRRWRG
jgi:ribosomal-protein-alanine N-acetyltransferase